jgi:hypothetical protein
MKMKDERKLFVVYSAARWQPSSLGHMISALLSPGRDRCGLARLTCGRMGEKKEWRDLLRGLDFPSASMGAGEFSAAFPKASIAPPCIMFLSDGTFRTVAGAKEIGKCKSLRELATLVRLGLRLAA